MIEEWTAKELAEQKEINMSDPNTSNGKNPEQKSKKTWRRELWQ